MRKLRLCVLLSGVCLLAVPAVGSASVSYGGPGSKPSCASNAMLCTEVAKPAAEWGHYVGHDEPSLIFYSYRAGSGNSMSYTMRLPKDPPPAFTNSKSFNFELHPAFWFGMAMCDNYSYPQTTRTCTPDSDNNIVDVTKSSRHPGTAFMELQFYSPGWVQQFAGYSCDPTKWCAALNIDSYSENPVAGTDLNDTCQSQILGGIEYVNFAYLTRDGQPQGPPNPLEFQFFGSGQPGPSVLYMNPGDRVTVSLHDTSHGLIASLDDHTTGQRGFMVASAANGFGHIVPAPSGTSCQLQYYDFHPMYSTSSPRTTVPWAAHTYNVAFSDEIGHFDFCTHISAATGSCDGMEGVPGDQEPADGDDNFCFFGEESLRYPATGCTDSNDPGFDGPSYQPDWPDGNTAVHPTPILFTSPRTNGGEPYSRVAFEADMPAIEFTTCNSLTGAGCTNPPPTDEGSPAAFYPYYSTTAGSSSKECWWGLGAHLPKTLNNFGGSAQTEYGALIPSDYYVYNGGGSTLKAYENYRRILPSNPC